MNEIFIFLTFIHYFVYSLILDQLKRLVNLPIFRENFHKLNCLNGSVEDENSPAYRERDSHFHFGKIKK